MKKEKKCLRILSNVLDIVIPVLLIVFTSFFVFSILAEVFGKQLCEDVSVCYSVAVFLVGIIITLKIKILDSRKETKEVILFIVGAFVNTLFLIVSFAQYCSPDSDKAILILNATIWADFIIVMRNIYLVIKIYVVDILKNRQKQKSNSNLKSNKDLFEYWLEKKKENKLVERALTDRSYKQIDHNIKDSDTNFELSTLGDSIIKFCSSNLLFNSASQLSAEKAKYESDKHLVEVVAKHYDLLSHIRKDNNDLKMPNDYKYEGRKSKNNPHKFIAIAVEAMVATIYKETNDLEAITKMVDEWRKL